MKFNPFQSLATGGLEDFDESERIEAEIHPLVKELVKKAEEINVPIHIAICNSMHTKPGGVGSDILHICNGRVENGGMRLPITFKALSAVAQDPDLAMETVLKYLKRNDPIITTFSNALREVLSDIDKDLNLENNNMEAILKSLSAFNNKYSHKPVKDSRSDLMDKIISDGLKPEGEEED